MPFRGWLLHDDPGNDLSLLSFDYCVGYDCFRNILCFSFDPDFCVGSFEAQRQYRLEEIEQFYPVTAKFPYPRLYADIIYGSDAFALALGAITVGLGFHNEIMKMTDATSAYDLVLNNGQAFNTSELQKIDATSDVAYQQKEDKDTIYYDRGQFNQTPFMAKEFTTSRETKKKSYDGETLAKDLTASDQLRSLELPEQSTKKHQFLSSEEFAALPMKATELRLIHVSDFTKDKAALKQLAEENFVKNPTINKDMGSMNQKALVYELYNALFSGFEFMGFFLGIAFLTMLASCLMFKILSGAKSDIQRYSMLEKLERVASF